MKRVVLALLLLLGACAHASARSTTIVLRGETPVEQNILRQYRYVASLNASVGDPETAYLTGRAHDTSHYRRVIETRLEADLARLYGRDLRGANRTYLLLGRRGGRDIVEVIRIGSFEQDGTYVPLEGLTYYFDPTNRAMRGVLRN